LWLAVAAIVVAIVTRIPSERQPLHDDDWFYLDRIQTRGVLGAFPGTDFLLMRPAVVFWFAGLKVFGLHPLPWHVLAAGLLGLTAWLVGRLLLRLGLAPLQAFVGASFFLLHPAWDIPIAWTAAVSSIVGDLFAVLCLLVLFGAARWRLPKAAVLLLLALLSKETAALLPFTAAAFMLVRGRPAKAIVRDTAGLLAVVALYSGVLRPTLIQSQTPSVYHLSVGRHVVHNLYTLLPYLTWLPSRFDWSHAKAAGAVLCLLAAAAALRPGAGRGQLRRLSLAAMLGVGLGLAPVLLLDRQAMFAYYPDMALISGAVLVGCLTPSRVRVPAVAPVAVAATAGVAGLALAVSTAVYTASNPDIPRTRQVLAGALRITHTSGGIVVHYVEPRDAYVTAGGALYRVLSGNPHLRVVITGVGITPRTDQSTVWCDLKWFDCG
jgi:hypothetical protein